MRGGNHAGSASDDANAKRCQRGTRPLLSSYQNAHISIQIDTRRLDDTTVYIADVTLSSPEYLKTALAQNAYGENVTEMTSAIAARQSAILAINGDYYGSRERGYVLRNGTLYRSTAAADQEDLVIFFRRFIRRH